MVLFVNTPCQPVIAVPLQTSLQVYAHDSASQNAQWELLFVVLVGGMHRCYFCSLVHKL